jgi:hypothetical protein
MRCLAAIMLLAFSTLAVAQSLTIKSGSTVFIAPMDGYETYLMAAFAKKHVPLIVVADRTKADYIIRSTFTHSQPSGPSVVINNSNENGVGNNAFQSGFQTGAAERAAHGTTSASISVIDGRTSQIVFAYSVGKDRATNQIQSAAEACAKHLKEFIEKSEKPKK